MVAHMRLENKPSLLAAEVRRAFCILLKRTSLGLGMVIEGFLLKQEELCLILRAHTNAGSGGVGSCGNS